MAGDTPNDISLKLTTSIVTSYLENNDIQADQLPDLIAKVYAKIDSIGHNVHKGNVSNKPIVDVKKSFTNSEITCLHCGSKHRTIKRHLMSSHQQTPEEYKEHFGLPLDYPIVTSEYSAKRSTLAKNLGLGRKTGQKMKKTNTKSGA